MNAQIDQHGNDDRHAARGKTGPASDRQALPALPQVVQRDANAAAPTRLRIRPPVRASAAPNYGGGPRKPDTLDQSAATPAADGSAGAGLYSAKLGNDDYL